jgi:uncharacterized protein YjiS (DUF1127 family)
MAHLLTSERPSAAAISTLFGTVLTWLATAKVNRARRAAYRALLNLDNHRLKDLGIARHDLFEAMERPDRFGTELSFRRARRSRNAAAR